MAGFCPKGEEPLAAGFWPKGPLVVVVVVVVVAAVVVAAGFCPKGDGLAPNGDAVVVVVGFFANGPPVAAPPPCACCPNGDENAGFCWPNGEDILV